MCLYMCMWLIRKYFQCYQDNLDKRVRCDAQQNYLLHKKMCVLYYYYLCYLNVFHMCFHIF